MFEYGFEEGKDFSLAKIGERSAHNKTDYALSLDCAKEISMLQRTERGKQARQYFIACEKAVKQNQLDLTNPKNILQIVQNWADEQEKRIAAESQIKALQPKVIFADAVAASETTILIGELAKILKQNEMPSSSGNDNYCTLSTYTNLFHSSIHNLVKLSLQ